MQNNEPKIRPCSHCGEIPKTQKAKCKPIIFYGIPLQRSEGFFLSCRCGKRTAVHKNLQMAFDEWNKIV